MNNKDLMLEANEWWDGLEEHQKTWLMDHWILQEYKELIAE